MNCKEIARLYGGEATYNAIENFMRKPKKVAQELMAQAEGKPAAAPSPVRPRKTATPKTTPKKDGESMSWMENRGIHC